MGTVLTLLKELHIFIFFIFCWVMMVLIKVRHLELHLVLQSV